jgi:hypothetical protein
MERWTSRPVDKRNADETGPRIAPLWGDTGGDLTLTRRRPPSPALLTSRPPEAAARKLVGSPRTVVTGISLLHPWRGELLDLSPVPRKVRMAATWQRVVAVRAAGREPRL